MIHADVQISDFEQRTHSSPSLRNAGLFAVLFKAALSNAAFQTHAQQFLRLYRKLHGQLPEYTLAESVHDHGDCIFALDAPLPQIEHLVFADLGGGSLMLHARRRIPHLDVWEGVSAALVADQ